MKKMRWAGGLLLMALLLSRPQAAAQAAARAMAHWYAAVAPSVFPFLALMPLLTCREAARVYERALGRAMGALFDLPGAKSPHPATQTDTCNSPPKCYNPYGV